MPTAGLSILGSSHSHPLLAVLRFGNRLDSCGQRRAGTSLLRLIASTHAAKLIHHTSYSQPHDTDPQIIQAWQKCGVVLIDVILLPILLIIHSVRIYLVPCISIYVNRFCCAICCIICTCQCWIYEDKAFPATSESLGSVEASVGDIVRNRTYG